MIKVKDTSGETRQIDNQSVFRLAKVTGSSSAGVLLQFAGESLARTKRYKRCAGYTPATGDTVLVARMGSDTGGTDVIIDKVV